MANMSTYDSCTVYALQFQNIATSKGLAEAHVAIGCILLFHGGIAGIPCHVSMVLEWQLSIVCSRPLLQSLAAYCHHSFCMSNAQLGLLHADMHSPSYKASYVAYRLS